MRTLNYHVLLKLYKLKGPPPQYQQSTKLGWQSIFSKYISFHPSPLTFKEYGTSFI